MSKDRWNDELSAYLDGEASDPEGVQRQLQDDPALAARHAQLARLSEHLRTLPEPDPRPEFLTRVMAHVREQESEARPSAWRPFALPLFSLAMLAIVAGMMLLREDTVTAPVETVAVMVEEPAETVVALEPVDDGVAAPAAGDLTDDDVVVARLAMLFAQGDVAADTAGGYYPEGETEGEAAPEPEYDAAWTILDDRSWEDAYLNVFSDESDWYSGVDSIPADAWDTFDDVLYDYVSEDLS